MTAENPLFPHRRADDPQGISNQHARENMNAVEVMRYFGEKFDAHVREETEKYSEVLDRLDQYNNASEVRHKRTEDGVTALKQSFAAFAEQERKFHENPCPQLQSAVPDADFAGHRRAHEALIKAAEDTGDLLKHIKKTVVTAAIISVGGWLILAAWAQFLKGPA